MERREIFTSLRLFTVLNSLERRSQDVNLAFPQVHNWYSRTHTHARTPARTHAYLTRIFLHVCFLYANENNNTILLYTYLERNFQLIAISAVGWKL